MVGLVAEGGFSAVTVRELTGLAGVSSRTFYQCYSSKEACFLDCQRLLTHRLLRDLALAKASARDPRDEVRRVVEALADQLSRNPGTARLLLIEPYTVGPPALEQMRRAGHLIGAQIRESLQRIRGGAGLPVPLVDGIVAGVTGVLASRLVGGRGIAERDIDERLAQWALSLCDDAAETLAELDVWPALHEPEPSFPSPVPSSNAESAEKGEVRSGDLALLFSAVTKLVIAEGYGSLSTRRLLAAAGVPRRALSRHFSSADDCFAAAVERRVAEAIGAASAAAQGAARPTGGVYRAILCLCLQAAHDPAFASVCFGEIGLPGDRAIRTAESVVAGLARLTDQVDTAPPGNGTDRVATEASAWAIWSAVRNEVVASHAQRAPQLASAMAYLMLAPTLGPRAAAEAIQREHALLSNGRSTPPQFDLRLVDGTTVAR